MKVMAIYIAIGVVFMFLVEALNHVYKEQIEFIGEDSSDFSMSERIIGIVIWPIIIVVFVKSLFK